MKHLGKILILLILIVVLAIIIKLSGFTGMFEANTQIEIKTTKLDKGRFVGGDKISITDQIRVIQTGEFVKEYPWQRIRNIRKEVNMEYLTESGYFVDDIISSERVDSLRDGKAFARSLIVKVPYPDTLFYQPAGDETIDKEDWSEGWTEGLLIDREAEMAFYIFLVEMKRQSYVKFIDEHSNPDSNFALSKAAMSLLRFVNNGYEIGDDIGFSSIQAIFEETTELGRPTIKVTCFEDGSCEQEILFGNSKLMG
jgi:hypothetical protein